MVRKDPILSTVCMCLGVLSMTFPRKMKEKLFYSSAMKRWGIKKGRGGIKSTDRHINYKSKDNVVLIVSRHTLLFIFYMENVYEN